MRFENLAEFTSKTEMTGSRSKKAAFIEEGYEGVRRVRLEEQKKKGI